MIIVIRCSIISRSLPFNVRMRNNALCTYDVEFFAWLCTLLYAFLCVFKRIEGIVYIKWKFNCSVCVAAIEWSPDGGVVMIEYKKFHIDGRII